MEGDGEAGGVDSGYTGRGGSGLSEEVLGRGRNLKEPAMQRSQGWGCRAKKAWGTLGSRGGGWGAVRRGLAVKVPADWLSPGGPGTLGRSLLAAPSTMGSRKEPE